MTTTDDRLAQIPYPRGLEREQRAVFDEPGPANIQSGVDLVQDAERADMVEDKALAELEGASPAVRKVLEVQGRHTSDRLAAEHQWRRDQIDTSAAISELAQGSSAQHRAHQRAQRAQDRMADTRPAGGDFPGAGRDRDTYEHDSWRRHLTERYGLDLDDLETDVFTDSDHGIPADDLHYRSPDLDDDCMEDVR